MTCKALADHLETNAVRAWTNLFVAYGNPVTAWVGGIGEGATPEKRLWLLAGRIFASLLADIEPSWEIDVVVDDDDRPTSILLIRTSEDEMDVKAVDLTWGGRVVRFGGKAHALGSKRAGAVIIRTLAEIVGAHFGATSS